MEKNKLVIFFISVLCFFVSCKDHDIYDKNQSDNLPLIGAIRWDGWSGSPDYNTNRLVHRTLAPKEFRDRIPFFGKEISNDSVQVADSSQQVMDQEIAYAKASQLDYWAFITFNPSIGLSISLHNYLKSEYRKDIRFCAISQEERFSREDTAYIAFLCRLIREPGYMTVLNGRPLWYIGFVDPVNVKKNWSSFHELKNLIDSIRKAIQHSGLKNPYIVMMDFDAALGKRWSDSLGCDAISSYVAQKGTPQASYRQLNNEVEQFWNECKATNAQVVPICVAGWNPKPRIDYHCEWSRYYPKDVYYTKATPAELANHIESGFQWLKENKVAAPAQCALIYAWNEFDEGGWLAPTLYDSTARIEAISEVIRVAKENYQ